MGIEHSENGSGEGQDSEAEGKEVRHQSDNPPAHKRYITSDKYRDWDLFFSDWMLSGVSVREYAARKGVSYRTLAKVAQKNDWLGRRDKMNVEIHEKFKDKMADKIAEIWVGQEKLWNAVEVQAAAILKKTISPDGHIINPMDPSELSSLTQALDRALKARKLIRGQDTGEGTNITVSMQILNWIEQRNKEVDEQK